MTPQRLPLILSIAACVGVLACLFFLYSQNEQIQTMTGNMTKITETMNQIVTFLNQATAPKK